MVTQERHQLIDGFLQQHLPEYERQPLAADASFRRYERIVIPNNTHILMDAPPPKEEVQTFQDITARLRGIQLHAPEIFAADTQNGFLLLEDLGGNAYSAHLQATPTDEWALYKAAIDVLVHLHQSDVSLTNLPTYNSAEYERELRIFTDWYLPTSNTPHEAQSFLAIWKELLATTPPEQNRMVLRDYHADNLMWLPTLTGLAQVGLLDYQDAILGDAAYDLVSLLEDARRDVSPSTASKGIAYYCQRMGLNEGEFRQRYALLGAQRNCKIIGIFHRLHQRDSKPHYLAFLPRVWAHLQTDLQHPALKPLQQWFSQHSLLAA